MRGDRVAWREAQQVHVELRSRDARERSVVLNMREHRRDVDWLRLGLAHDHYPALPKAAFIAAGGDASATPFSERYPPNAWFASLHPVASTQQQVAPVKARPPAELLLEARSAHERLVIGEVLDERLEGLIEVRQKGGERLGR